MKEILTWAPRIIALIYIGFLSLFALDAFDENHSFPQRITGFFIHLLPSFILMACLLIAWRHRILGGLIFLIVGMIFTVYFGTYQKASSFLMISVPLLLAGVLFILSKWSILEN